MYLALDPPADAAQAVRQSADQVRAARVAAGGCAVIRAVVDAVVDTSGRRGCYNRVVTIRIGGGQGFYGDGLGPVPDVLEAGVDYLVCEALAELTLAILQKDRQRDESLGFTRDLPMYVRAALPYVVDGRTRFITNAGGINPVAAGRAVVATLKEAGATGLVVATVVGDDVRPRGERSRAAVRCVVRERVPGARPIVDALDAGAHVVVTGRVADASLFLAPLVHEHKWAWDDWDRLAAGVVVGHLLECSGQVAGGNYSGPWWTNPDPLRVVFPIGECEPDGSAVITKPAQSGGMVTFDTVREQLLYEVHDPARYLNPDVVADFTSLTLTDLGGDRVRVSDTRGLPAPPTVQGPRVHARGLGGRGARSRIRGPTPRRRRVPRCGGSSSERSRRRCRSTSGSRSTSASTRSAGRPSTLMRLPSRRKSSDVSRGDAPTRQRPGESRRAAACSVCPGRRPSVASVARAVASRRSCSQSTRSQWIARSSIDRCASTSSRSEVESTV